MPQRFSWGGGGGSWKNSHHRHQRHLTPGVVSNECPGPNLLLNQNEHLYDHNFIKALSFSSENINKTSLFSLSLHF